ncbi:MAG: PEP-CTERM sorting domain-containing protein [Armatimonadetes bacterium]|nr:PEP-CTERM sorting domain-containing protein [Armatimonadota bacterium]
MKKVLILASVAISVGANAQLVYDNTTSFMSSAFAAGGTTSVSGVLTTNIVLDDLNMTGSGQLGAIKFAIANLNTSATTARMRLRFFQTDGTGGGPGTALGGVTFAATSIGTGVTLYSADLTANNIVLPSANLWVGFFFDNSGASGTTAAQLDKLGMGLYGPPTVGTSADKMFVSSTPGSFLSNNPAGTVFNSPFGGNPAANFGMQFNVVPEPFSMLALGAGTVALARKRRK